MSVQLTDPKKPDLEESTNVAEQHAAVSRASAAASREQQVRENGLEPVSIWIFIAGSIVAIIAGSVLFSSNNLFGYDKFVKAGYVQADETGGPPPVPQGEVEAVYMAKGAATYKKCMGCHQPDGKGNSAYPPLAGSEYVIESPVAVLMAAINGVDGPITAAGVSVNSNMGPQLHKSTENLEMAALAYYLQNSFGNKVGKIYTPEQMDQVKALNNERGEGNCTAAELDKYRKVQLTGDLFEPKTIINKKTGEVIVAE
ncbi:MAG: c-type cytochrome [Akkermansiaceae bacterium]